MSVNSAARKAREKEASITTCPAASVHHMQQRVGQYRECGTAEMVGRAAGQSHGAASALGMQQRAHRAIPARLKATTAPAQAMAIISRAARKLRDFAIIVIFMSAGA